MITWVMSVRVCYSMHECNMHTGTHGMHSNMSIDARIEDDWLQL